MSLEFVSEAEQARIDALPTGMREQLVELMRSWHEIRPDLNQPGTFGDLLDSMEETARLRNWRYDVESEFTTTGGETLVTLMLRFPADRQEPDQRATLANQLSPLIHEAISCGGRLLSVSVQNVAAEDD